MNELAPAANTVYLARISVLPTVTVDGSERTDKEALFSSWDEARNFLANEGLEDEDDESCLFYERHTIIAYRLDNPAHDPHCWVYDARGRLLREYSFSDDPQINKCEYTGKYGIGDIVIIKSNFECVESHAVHKIHGVVVSCPIQRDTWLAQHKQDQEWDGNYVVNYINEHAVFDHMHVPEHALEACQDKTRVPAFMELYSKYMKGQLQLPAALLCDLEEGKVFLRDDIKHFREYLSG